jgi:hypothetical protein
MVAQRELHPRGWWRAIRFIPFLMATGIGLAVTNAKAVIEAVLGRQSEFVRTPKLRVEGRQENWEHKKYLRRGGWIPAIELLLAGYFSYTTAYSVYAENYLTTPFLMLFLVGYSYMGTMSLLQAPLRRLWNALPALLHSHTVEPATS